MNATQPQTIQYAQEPHLSPEEFIKLLHQSGLDQRRPVDDSARIAKMLSEADLILTARDQTRLVGVARSLTDFCYCCYLSDLAVDKAYQHRGIGRRLIQETQKAIGPDTLLLLLSAPDAMAYYPKVGFQKEEVAWSIRPQ